MHFFRLSLVFTVSLLSSCFPFSLTLVFIFFSFQYVIENLFFREGWGA